MCSLSTQFLLSSILIFYIQLACGSSISVARQVLLKHAIIQEIGVRCSEKSAPIKRAIQWGLKELQHNAAPDLNRAELVPDPNLVSAYAEYFCDTKKIPERGRLPNESLVSSYAHVPTIGEELAVEEPEQVAFAGEEDNFGDALSMGSSSEIRKAFISLFTFVSGVIAGAFGMQCYLMRSYIPSNASVTKLRRPEL